jgi:hypothetical protein
VRPASLRHFEHAVSESFVCLLSALLGDFRDSEAIETSANEIAQAYAFRRLAGDGLSR